MATQALVDRRIDDGERLLEALDAASLQVPVALWLFTSEWGEWRLTLASPLVDQVGPREVYRQVQRILANMPDLKLRLDQTWVVGLANPLIAALRSAIRIGPENSGVRLTSNVLNGIFVEDAYVYRLR